MTFVGFFKEKGRDALSMVRLVAFLLGGAVFLIGIAMAVAIVVVALDSPALVPDMFKALTASIVAMAGGGSVALLTRTKPTDAPPQP